MVIGSFIFDELKISNSCYMAAAIEFSKNLNTKTTPCSIFFQAPSSPIWKGMHSSIYSFGESPPFYLNSAESLSKNK